MIQLFFIGLVVDDVRCQVCPNSKLYDTFQVPRLVLHGPWVTSSGEIMKSWFIFGIGYTFQSLFH